MREARSKGEPFRQHFLHLAIEMVISVLVTNVLLVGTPLTEKRVEQLLAPMSGSGRTKDRTGTMQYRRGRQVGLSNLRGTFSVSRDISLS